MENRGSKQSGGAAIEYAALLASIAAMIVVSVSLLGSNLSGIFGNLNFGQPQQLPFIYVGQNIWCQAATGVCSLSNGTAVNIQTLRLSN